MARAGRGLAAVSFEPLDLSSSIISPVIVLFTRKLDQKLSKPNGLGRPGIKEKEKTQTLLP
jgi:hypothetical protein